MWLSFREYEVWIIDCAKRYVVRNNSSLFVAVKDIQVFKSASISTIVIKIIKTNVRRDSKVLESDDAPAFNTCVRHPIHLRQLHKLSLYANIAKHMSWLYTDTRFSRFIIVFGKMSISTVITPYTRIYMRKERRSQWPHSHRTELRVSTYSISIRVRGRVTRTCIINVNRISGPVPEQYIAVRGNKSPMWKITKLRFWYISKFCKKLSLIRIKLPCATFLPRLMKHKWNNVPCEGPIVNK
jgi:hypothetical protein